MAEKKQPVPDAPFEVVAEKLWHSTECRFYYQGDTVMLPANLKVTEDSSVRPVDAKAKAKKADADIA